MAKNIVTIISTHGGFVNNNNTWYLEEDMANAINTWTEPFNKPVLTHHDIKKDSIGRVLSAKFVPMKSTGGNNSPKCYIELKAEITDSDAVTKIKDKRYNTVSISTDATKAYCSICNRNIPKDGLCEHIKGKVYDGKKCFWYLGGLKYKEVSYVNAPADEYAYTENFEDSDGVINYDSPTVVTDIEISESDYCEDWDSYTEDDLKMANWLLVEMDSELSEDNKISTETKKKMKTSVFCGPNRSFPIPDCSHVTAAKRLIGKYKGPGNKSKILACVNRKATALGCDASKDSLTTEVNSMVITLKDALDNDEVKKHIDSEIQRVTNSFQAQLVTLSDMTQKVVSLEGVIKSKDEENSSNIETIKRLEDSVILLKTESHKNLVDRVYDLRKNLRKVDVMSLKDETETDLYKADLAKRTDESLKDAISDLSKENTLVGIKDGTIVTSSPNEVIQTSDAEKTAPTKKSRKEIIKDIFFKD